MARCELSGLMVEVRDFIVVIRGHRSEARTADGLR